MEDKKFIEQQLSINAEAFIQFITIQTEPAFIQTPNGKWSVGQNLEHLIRSLAPVNLALQLPGFLLRILFGKPNRKPRTYQELIDRYHQKLAAGGKASGRFVPPTVSWNQRENKMVAFDHEKSKMIKGLNAWSESQLDQYLLPHPLLGKLTLREMLFFSAYHIRHHHMLLKERQVSS